ncbi:MAG: glycosyltransferase [Candidatus Kryptoniota bacterium]
MKKVLIVSYYFPPSGGPGVQRVLKFVKYLPQFGFEPVVLTVADADFPAVDESLLQSIPKDIKVIRTKIFEPYNLYRRFTGKQAGAAVDVENIPSGKKKGLSESLAEIIRSTFFIPDARIGWLPYAVSAATSIMEQEKVDIIYSSSPPYTTAMIAKKLKKKTGKPWVMGLRDPWTDFISAPKRWFLPAAIDRSMEENSVHVADAVEIAWEGIGKDLKKKYGTIDPLKIVHIPNGYDSEDYPAVSQPKDMRLRMAYTGSLYGKRNPQTLLDAMKELREAGKISADNLNIIFAGRFGAEVREMFADPRLTGMIEVKDYLPHEESIKLLLQSNLLVLIVDRSELSNEIVPGKVFEYIGARKPIIAFAPEGAVAEIIRKTGTGIVVPQDDVAKAKSVILSFYKNSISTQPSSTSSKEFFNPKEDAIKEFERKEATKKLSSLFTEIIERKNG